MDLQVINIDKDILGGTPVFFWHESSNKKTFRLSRKRRYY